MGRCHTDRSGFEGPWTNAPTTFSNLYFTELTDNKWRKRDWSGELRERESGACARPPPHHLISLFLSLPPLLQAPCSTRTRPRR